MLYSLYIYISKPTTEQVGSFLNALANSGISITHLGKNDPPRKYDGELEEAVSQVFSGKDLTDYTFIRDKTNRLEFDFQIHHDPRWKHSTISASCPDTSILSLLVDSASQAFDLFIAVRGVLGAGKGQAWEIIHKTDRCPPELLSKFVTT